MLFRSALGRPEKLRRSLCDLGTVVNDVVFLVEPSFRHHKVRLKVVQKGELETLEADAEQLGQAVMNLVLNARDAAGPGGWVRLELATNEPGQCVLRVFDSGPGPPPEMHGQLFEAFTTSKPEGVGLGLAVARQIVESHRGTLRFAPRSDTTCFELCLQIGRAHV